MRHTFVVLPIGTAARAHTTKPNLCAVGIRYRLMGALVGGEEGWKWKRMGMQTTRRVVLAYRGKCVGRGCLRRRPAEVGEADDRGARAAKDGDDTRGLAKDRTEGGSHRWAGKRWV